MLQGEIGAVVPELDMVEIYGEHVLEFWDTKGAGPQTGPYGGGSCCRRWV